MTTDLADLARNIFARVQADEKIPNVAYGVYIDGKTVAEDDADRQYRIASMTKSFIASAILLLRDRGQVLLDTAVSEYVPELQTLQPLTVDSPNVSLRHLLTNSAGFATDDPYGDRKMAITPQEMSALMAEGIFSSYAVNTAFSYSNYGFAILGRVITNVAGVQYQQFIKSEILDPLEMNSTGFSSTSDHIAQPFRIQDDEAIPDNVPPSIDGEFGAMAGIWSTVADLNKWMSFMCDAFPARNDNDDGPLKRSSRREMHQLQRIRLDGAFDPSKGKRNVPSGYGMGLFIQHDPLFGHIAMHPGGLPGYGSQMMWLPERKVAMVSLGNVTYAPMRAANVDLLTDMEELGVLPSVPKIDAPEIDNAVERLVALLNSWDDNIARDLFALNMELEESFDRRRAAVQQLGLVEAVEITPFNRSQAKVIVRNQSGEQFKLFVGLSPESSPKIQSYEWVEGR